MPAIGYVVSMCHFILVETSFLRKRLRCLMSFVKAVFIKITDITRGNLTTNTFH